MKKIVSLVVVIAVATVSSYGQFDLGDAELNTWMASISNKFKAHTSDFRFYVTSTYKVHPNKYDHLQNDVGMNPNDIYLAAAIAKAGKKSIDDVITTYTSNKAKGWGAIAKESGVTPGSPAFEALKDDAYKLANGTARPKPKPVVAKSATKPATKTATKSSTKTKSTTKPKPKTKPKPAVKN